MTSGSSSGAASTGGSGESTGGSNLGTDGTSVSGGQTTGRGSTGAASSSSASGGVTTSGGIGGNGTSATGTNGTSGGSVVSNGCLSFTNNPAGVYLVAGVGSCQFSAAVGRFGPSTLADDMVFVSLGGVALGRGTDAGLVDAGSVGFSVTYAVAAGGQDDAGFTEVLLYSGGPDISYSNYTCDLATSSCKAFCDDQNACAAQAPGAPSSTAIADFDQDGVQDLVQGFADSGTLAIFLGTGDGGFSSAPTLSLDCGRVGGIQGTNTSVYAIAPFVGDFNGDGRPDVVCGFQNLSCFYEVWLSSAICDGG